MTCQDLHATPQLKHSALASYIATNHRSYTSNLCCKINPHTRRYAIGNRDKSPPNTKPFAPILSKCRTASNRTTHISHPAARAAPRPAEMAINVPPRFKLYVCCTSLRTCRNGTEALEVGCAKSGEIVCGDELGCSLYSIETARDLSREQVLALDEAIQPPARTQHFKECSAGHATSRQRSSHLHFGAFRKLLQYTGERC